MCYTHGGAIGQVKRKAAERLADLIDPQRALREAARLAYSDIRMLFDAEGHFLPITQWPDELAAAIGGIEFTKRNLTAGDGAQEDVVKIKLWDKPKNVELLFRHLGLIKDQHTIDVIGLDRLLALLEPATLL